MANIHATLSSLFTAVANAIRSKNGTTQAIIANNFPSEITNLKTGFDYNNQNVISVSDYEFYNCTDLKNVDCSNLISIGVSAFENCTNLKTIILYDGVANIGENAFKGCDNVIIYCKATSQPDTWHENWNPDNRPVLYGELIETWDISATEEDNVTAELRSADSKYTLFVYGNGNMKNFTFSDSTAAPWSSYKANITFAIVYDGVTSIGTYAFSKCSSLTSVTIPDSVTSIGNCAFHRCSNLTSITIPDGVTSIGSSAFDGCSSLTSIAIPDNVTSIGTDAFYGCTGLTGVYITDLTAWNSIEFKNYASNPLYCAHNLYLNNQLVTELAIPDSVTSIGQYAFNGCSSLTSITIPDSVTNIGSGAFNGCSSLTSITIPNSVTNIGSGAFANCTGLTSIAIPDSVTSISNGAFNGCSSLTSITIPDSVTNIDNSVFRGCTGLTSIIIPDSVTSIGINAFYGCTGLTSITIPNSVTSISDEAFYGCTGLTSVAYTGTIAQWNAITFGSYWNNNTGDYTIRCTDGDIAKDGTITYHPAE